MADRIEKSYNFSKKMPLDFTAYYDGEKFIGFTIVYPRKQFNWYWYFAV